MLSHRFGPQGAYALSLWEVQAHRPWGSDGLVDCAGVIASFGLTDPKPFLNAVLQRPYANQVVISPHYYPPSISGQKSKCATFLWNKVLP